MTRTRRPNRQLTRCRRGQDRASKTICLRSGLCWVQRKIQRWFLALLGRQRSPHARLQSLSSGSDASRPLRFRATRFVLTFPAASLSQAEAGAGHTYRRPEPRRVPSVSNHGPTCEIRSRNHIFPWMRHSGDPCAEMCQASVKPLSIGLGILAECTPLRRRWANDSRSNMGAFLGVGPPITKSSPKTLERPCRIACSRSCWGKTGANTISISG